VVTAPSSLGRRFGARVIAEGVETEEQLERARKAGCVEAQGFLFGQPAAAAVIGKQLHDVARARRK
jgi:EAL domain-containing protein (putative c-di-GMP-specific phosphodiesterase class I)